MRIVIDGRMLGWTGIGRYTKNLLTELEKLDRRNEYLVLVQSKDWQGYRPKAKNFQKHRADIEPYGVANQTRLPALIKKLKPDLVHFTHFTVPLTYKDPFVVTVHDLTLVDYRNVRGGTLKSLAYSGKQVAMKKVLTHALKQARAVITPSQFVAGELRRRFRVDSSRLAITYEAAEKLAGRPAKALKTPFIFYLGNYYPHKNISLLLEAFKEVLINHPDLQLVLAGQADYFQEQIKKLARRLKVERSVLFPGPVSDSQLLALYKNAELFVFPSLSEGFGLPPLEAMAQGTPVLSSDATSLPEILGDAALYFDPQNAEDLAAKLDALLNSPDELKRLRHLGPKQAAKYSWTKMAEETLAVYRKSLR